MSQQINLFNPVFLQTKKVFAAATMAQALGLLVIGVVALGLYGKSRVAVLQKQADLGAVQLEQKQARLASVNKDFAPRQKSAELETQLLEAQGRLAALRQVAGVLEHGELGDTHGYSEYFRGLARQHVEGLWLTGVSVAGAGSEIGVRGRALDPALLPGYLSRLAHEPAFQGKAFGSLQIGQAGPLKLVDKDGKESVAPAPFVEFSLQSAPEGTRP